MDHTSTVKSNFAFDIYYGKLENISKKYRTNLFSFIHSSKHQMEPANYLYFLMHSQALLFVSKLKICSPKKFFKQQKINGKNKTE